MKKEEPKACLILIYLHLVYPIRRQPFLFFSAAPSPQTHVEFTRVAGVDRCGLAPFRAWSTIWE